jgi:rfaE bifunctional protein nucleotidyltransferase chain/domain
MSGLDGVFSARALFIAAELLASADALDRRRLDELGQVFRIVSVGLAPVPMRGVELHASWMIGDAAGGPCGVRHADATRGLRPALDRILQTEAASRTIIDPERLALRALALRRRGRRIVFTNGVFDLLHVGHIRLLEQARLLGDVLVVGINSDDSTRSIKGPRRPVVPQFARARILSSLRPVDYCFIFTETDPKRALEILRPDVLVKGSDYTMSQVVGAKLVKSWGGTVARIPIVGGYSTTSTIRAIEGQRNARESSLQRS